jgi:hypothetical protein
LAGLAADAAHLIGFGRGYSGSRYTLLPAADTLAQSFSSMPYIPYNIPIYYDHPIQQQTGDYRNAVVAARNNIIALDADSSATADDARDRDQRQIQIRYRPGYKKG